MYKALLLVRSAFHGWKEKILHHQILLRIITFELSSTDTPVIRFQETVPLFIIDYSNKMTEIETRIAALKKRTVALEPSMTQRIERVGAVDDFNETKATFTRM